MPDNATDRVYQYDNSVSRASGSQAASPSFALNTFNTNPQGIADPPALTIADATAVEGGTDYRFTVYFVARLLVASGRSVEESGDVGRAAQCNGGTCI